MLTAVVTQAGDAFSVHLIESAPPNTSEGDTTDTVAETTDTVATGSEGGSGDPNVVETDDGLVAKDGVAHVPVSEAAPGPNPIIPELKELVWGASAFIVLALIIRYVAFPKLRAGMDARYAHIRDGHESADSARATAQAEVAEYQAQIAALKAEAAVEVEAARQQLEAERSARLAEVNAILEGQRATARAETDAARAAVQDHVAAAVSDVVSSAVRLAIGRNADAAVVDRAVTETLSVGAVR